MKVSKKQILNEAKEIKEFADKNHKLPSYATINNSRFSPAQYTYLLAKMVSNIKTESIGKKLVKEPTSPVGNKINSKILKNNYLDMATRVARYIEINGIAPNYVEYNGIPIRYELYTYCFAKILKYYNENNTYPNYCIFNSTDIQYNTTSINNNQKNNNPSISSSKKITTASKTTTANNSCTNPYTSEPHLTTTSVGLGQEYPWDCSANAVQQCLYKLSNKKIAEKTLIQVGGVTTNGVGHDGINTMIAWFNKKYKTNYKVTWKNFSDLGKTRDERFLALAKLLCKKNTAVLTHIGYCGSGSSFSGKIFGHYEVLDKINTKTKYVRALNSLGNKINSNAYKGHLQDRSFELQAKYFANTPGGQKALCIITK